MIRSASCLAFLVCLLISPLVAPLAAQFDPVAEIVLPSGSSSTWIKGVAQMQGYVYVLASAGDFYVYDARNLSVDGPFRTLNTPISSSTPGGMSLLRRGNALYIGGGGAFTIKDLTNPAAPVTAGEVGGGAPSFLTASNNYLFATGDNSVSVYSIADPFHPTLLASSTLDGRYGESIALYGDYIYVGTVPTALRVYSWAGGATITFVREIALEATPYHLFVNGAHLAGILDSAVVWSLADPTFPLRTKQQPAAGRLGALWGNKLITNGVVYSWHGPSLEKFSQYAQQETSTGSPVSVAGTAEFVFLPGRKKITVLATPPTLIFPQYVNGQAGARNSTRLVLRNSGTTKATGVARFRTSAGTANPVPISGVSKSEVTYSMLAGGTFQVTTDGTGALTNGPLEIRSDAIADLAISGTEIFDLLGYSVSVQSAPLAKVHRAFVSRTAAEDTGVAMYNPSFDVPCEVEARLFDTNGGEVAAPVTLTLAARNQRAIFVTDASLFKSYIASLPGGFEGTMQLNVTAGGPIAVLSLLQKSNNALLAVPVESETPPGP